MAVPQVDEMLEAREVPDKNSKKTKKEEKRFLLVAQELKIANALSGNDKALRHRALKSLKKWFHHRSQNLPFTEEDFLRLWKGLFYSMWMSDKPLIQEECAENIASLLHELPLQHSLVLFKCGLITLTNEWFGIDQLRLDKFMMFVRRFLRQGLVVLKKDGFKKSSITKFGDILSLTVLDPNKKDAMGLFMHFTEIFLEELAKITEGNLKPELVTDFLIPFIKCLAVSEDVRRVKQLRKFVFIHLMAQSDAGLEYREKYSAWKKEGFPGTIHSMKKVELNEDDDNSSDDEGQEEEAQASSLYKALDPRAGRVDVELPQIKFFPKAVADMLLKHKYLQGSTVESRKTMTTLSQQFRKLAQGTYALGVTDLKLPKSDIKDMNIKKAVNRLVKFEKKLIGEDPRTKKRKLKELENGQKIKKRKIENKTEEIDNNDDNDDFHQQLENFIANSEGSVKNKKLLLNKSTEKGKGENSKVKKRKLLQNETNIFQIETPLRKKVKKLPKLEVQAEPECTFERNSGVWCVYNQDDSYISSANNSCADLGDFLESEIDNMCDSPTKSKVIENTSPKKKFDVSPKKSQVSPEKSEVSPKKSEVSPKKSEVSPKKSEVSPKKSEVSPKKSEVSPKKSNVSPNQLGHSILRGKSAESKKKLNSSNDNWVVNGVDLEPESETPNGESEERSPFKTPTKELFPKNPWDEPLEEGEYEICVPSKSYVEKLKKISRKSTQNVQELINNRLGKSRYSLDSRSNINASTPQNAKRVKINTKLNQSQEFHEYHSQMLTSPVITFDASKKPGKPLLKTPVIESPRNPFYKQLYDF